VKVQGLLVLDYEKAFSDRGSGFVVVQYFASKSS